MKNLPSPEHLLPTWLDRLAAVVFCAAVVMLARLYFLALVRYS